MRRPEFEEYAARYDHLRLERSDGIVQVTMHSDGADVEWGFAPHEELGYCLQDLGADPDNRVVILTGAGDAFIGRQRMGGGGMDAMRWADVQAAGRRLLLRHLEIEVPMIAAVNGPATIHAEIALLCDIVLATEDAVYADRPHFGNGVVPGDGVHVVWPMLLGANRGRYFLLTGQELTATEAHALGIVNELLPRDELIDRAWSLARTILERPAATVRFARTAMVQELRRAVSAHLDLGLALEGLAATDHWPESFG